MSATVLIVDDDRAFRELVADILGPEGYRLLEAGSAEEALRLAEAAQRLGHWLTERRGESAR